MADARSIEFLSGSRSGPGTRMAVDTRFGPLRTRDVIEITGWEPERRIAVRHRGLFTGAGEFRLEDHDGGTRFTWTEEIRFPWWLGGRLGALAARPLFGWVWRRNLGRLRSRLSSP
jgi:carbon monoxide dehydrogenase subunit G